jgi:hypothetical protein
MNRVLHIATLLAASMTPSHPVWNGVFRPREDGSLEDAKGDGPLVVAVDAPAEPRMDGARAAAMLREIEARPTIGLGALSAHTDYRATGRRPTRSPPYKEPKDRSKAKAARKARKKNRGR